MQLHKDILRDNLQLQNKNMWADWSANCSELRFSAEPSEGTCNPIQCRQVERLMTRGSVHCHRHESKY